MVFFDVQGIHFFLGDGQSLLVVSVQACGLHAEPGFRRRISDTVEH